jgi:hypothetical protein
MYSNFTLFRLIPVHYVPSILWFLELYRGLCTECFMALSDCVVYEVVDAQYRVVFVDS